MTMADQEQSLDPKEPPLGPHSWGSIDIHIDESESEPAEPSAALREWLEKKYGKPKPPEPPAPEAK